MPKSLRSASGQRRIMQAIRSTDTKPELFVRSLLYRLGYRFRTHARTLPGTPDIVFTARKKAIFVHGCFWHAHDDPNCPDNHRPQSNADYWNPKLDRNVQRDHVNIKSLGDMGWEVLTLWACQLSDVTALTDQVTAFLGDRRLKP